LARLAWEKKKKGWGGVNDSPFRGRGNRKKKKKGGPLKGVWGKKGGKKRVWEDQNLGERKKEAGTRTELVSVLTTESRRQKKGQGGRLHKRHAVKRNRREKTRSANWGFMEKGGFKKGKEKTMV